MGKRSDFPRRERDYYPTPRAAVEPLVPHLPTGGRYCEPCAGDGRLVEHLRDLWDGECVWAVDVEPQADGLHRFDALDLFFKHQLFITNPPWPQRGGEPTLAIAEHLSSLAPTWLLLSSDFAHNRYFSRLSHACAKIVSVGRVSWMENGTAGKDNAAWYLFDARHIGPTRFFGRAA